MLQTPALREAIENLYQVFQRYHLRTHTDACPCCHSEQDEQRIHRKPLHKLSSEDLHDYAVDAIYTWGTGDDFKHFLPRLLELLTQRTNEGPWFPDPANIFTKLTYESWCSTSWKTWPESEQGAIVNYFRAVWHAALNSNPEDLRFDGIHGWLQALSQAEHDLSPYLDQWLEAPSVNSHRNLARMITEGLPQSRGPSGGYWGGHREQWEQVNDWLRRPEVRRKLADAVEKWSDLPFANEFVDAAILLPSSDQS
jgi:hypothetical protein